MALFGKLFEKKICDICGGEIGLLGNRKLEDGNMCKDCAKKLSPFFDERRHSTVAQIKEQLAYREANKAEVSAFRTTRTYGENFTKLLVDETAGKFMVTSADDLNEANPDVIRFEDVSGCELDIDESYDEITYTDRDGNEASFKPPRYRFEYDFALRLKVRNPYFDDIDLRLNRENVIIEAQLRPGMTVESFRNDRRLFNPAYNSEYSRYNALAEEIRTLLLCLNTAPDGCAAPAAGAPGYNTAGQPCAAPDNAAQSVAAPAKTECPSCGAPAAPGAAFCEFCGSKL